MNAPLRRGACPALSDPMPTGDGLIARLTLTEAISPATLAGLADASMAHGNGLMEITQRGNLQFRGLTAESAPLLADAVNGLGIKVPTGLTVDVGPLAGIDPDEVTDPRPIAETIRKAAAPLAGRLGPKVSVVVDGRGKLVLDAVQTDIRLEAACERLWRLSVGGKSVGFVSEPAMAALEVLNLIAERGRDARGRDIEARILDDQLRSLLVDDEGEVSAATVKSAIGIHDLGAAGMMLGIGVAFGQVPAATLLRLARSADGWDRPAPRPLTLTLSPHCGERESSASAPASQDPSPRFSRGEGKGEGRRDVSKAERTGPSGLIGAAIRPAPGRCLLVLGLSEQDARTLTAQAETLGFVTRPGDPRLFVAACAGSEGCASGQISTHAIAAQLATRAPTLLDGSLTVHVSGCAKGCAHPGPAALAFVGDAEGAGLVVQGTASGRPTKHLAADQIIAEAERLSKLVHLNGHDGETSAACLTRLGTGDQSERAA